MITLTREQAAEIKRAINQEERYRTYYDRTKRELRVQVIRTPNKETALSKQEVSAICNVLSMAQGIRAKYRIDRKQYQGFVNITYVVFQ